MQRVATLRNLMRLAADSSGATAVAYALIMSAVAGIIVAVVYVLGAKTNNLYNEGSY
jgi:Flp pilus assembly pilin Flp